MKVLLAMILMLALLSGCEGNVPPYPEHGSAAELSGSDAEIPPPEQQTPQPEGERVDPALWDNYSVVIEPLRQKNLLDKSWQSIPEPVDEDNWYYPYVITDIVKLGDATQISLEFYYTVILNIETLWEQRYYTDQNYHNEITIMGEGPMAPNIPVGKTVLTARRTDFGWDYISCEYTPYEAPGIAYLSSVNESIAAELAASEKPDLSAYDPGVVRYIYKKLAAKRLIRSIDDITMYDLNTFLTKFDFYDMTIEPSSDNKPPVIESSILRLMSGLTEFGSYRRLSDYSVFEDMPELERMYLYSMTDEDFAALKADNLKYLHLIDTDAGTADLSGIKSVDTLTMQSWFTGVGSFKGCEDVKTLYIIGTRTDPQLYNPENFPNVERIVIDSYRDYPRAVDYSRLAEFEGVDIDIQLQYFACDNAAVSSLAGISLRRVYLSPDREARTGFDMKLIDALTAEDFHLDEYTDFAAEVYGYQ